MTFTGTKGEVNGHVYHNEVIDLPFHTIPFVSCFISLIDNTKKLTFIENSKFGINFVLRSLLGSLFFSSAYYQRRLMKRRGTVCLSCTKQMGSARSSMRTTHPFHCPPETLIHFDLAVNLVGGANVVCFVSLFINRAIHTTL